MNLNQFLAQISMLQMDVLKDPKSTRIIKSLPLPPHKPLSPELLFENKKINWQFLRNFLKRQGKIAADDFIKIIEQAKLILKSEANIICINDPVTIVGDIHGQFYDFIKLLENDIGGNPLTTKYLFLGDYVDRGSFSIEVLILILSLKINRPQSAILLRGNHECRQLTSHFNFRTECLLKYGQDMYQRIMDLFDCFPLACIINNRFLCIHGGISTQLKGLDDIAKINRFRQIPKGGLFCDLMWADPYDTKTGVIDGLMKPNQARGCSYYFGYELTKQFCERNKIMSIIRAHEAQAEGYKMYEWFGKSFPSVITVFSAPNYCDFYNNCGAVVKFQNNTVNIQQFKESPHPYLLPNFMDLFTWSIPFVTQKINEMLYHLIQPGKNTTSEKGQLPFQFLDKRKLLESILKMQHQKTEQNMEMVNLDGHVPDDRLLESLKLKKAESQAFEERKEIDSLNESRPFEGFEKK